MKNALPADESSSLSPARPSQPLVLNGRQLFAVFLLAVAVLAASASAARADEFVAFSDASLRAAVAGQLVAQGEIPPGSLGTTVTTSDMETITSLSAPNRRIVRLEGLQYCVNLATLDLHGNRIAAIDPLGSLTHLTDLDVRGNDLDLATGSSAMSVIATLEAGGTRVSYKPQRVGISELKLSSSASTFGKLVTFSASIAPRGAGLSGVAKVRLCRLETKTVTKRVGGKRRRVAVNYWRVRSSVAMRASSAGILSAKAKLPYAGQWEAQVVYAGRPDYDSYSSATKAFLVHDPRIEAAIRWAMRRLGQHGWDHYCLRFVCDAYASGARASVQRYGTARQAAGALHASAHRSGRAPRGAWVFYDSTPNGHVGISLGNGTIINDYGGAGVEVMSIGSAGHYVGWAPPPLSPPICDWKTPPKR